MTGPARTGGRHGGRGRGLRIALQALGFALGVALLWWAVASAFASPAQRAQLEKLAAMPWGRVLALIALSVATVALDGLCFRAVLRPVRTLPRVGVVAVAGVCSALSYLPFKMSLLFRVVFHKRRNGLSVLVIGSWVLATAAVLLASLVPVAVAGFVVDPGPAWWAVAAGGTVALAWGGHLLARALARDTARGRIARLAGSAGVRWAERVVMGAAFARLWTGVHLLADRRAFGNAMALRTLIIVCQGVRFYLAASWLGVELRIEDALVAGSAYNLLQAVAPTGVGGLREWGAHGALAMLGSPGMMAVVLAVTATEAATNLALGVWGGVYVRAHTLLAPDAAPPTPAPPPAPTPKADAARRAAGGEAESGDATL